MEGDLPKEVILRPGRGKWFGVAGVSGVFFAMGITLFFIVPGLAWFMTLGFGAASLMSLLQIFGRQTYLKLDIDGFEHVTLGRRRTFRWEEVSAFGIWGREQGFARDEFVSFDVLTAPGASPLPGGATTLGDTFGMGTEALADLMNAFRTRALQAKGAP